MQTVSHPLALRMRAQMQAKSFSARDVAIAMGYPDRPQSRLTERACIRLQTVLDDALLGLGHRSGGFDMKYDAKSFLVAALKVLDIPADTSAPYLEALCAKSKKRRWFYELCAEIDAGSVLDKMTPRFLGAMLVYGRRHVPLPDDVALLPEAQRQAVLQDALQRHYRQYAAKLPGDARIVGYCLRRIRIDGQVDDQSFLPCPV